MRQIFVDRLLEGKLERAGNGMGTEHYYISVTL